MSLFIWVHDIVDFIDMHGVIGTESILKAGIV
jgi:hypothetical protein